MAKVNFFKGTVVMIVILGDVEGAEKLPPLLMRTTETIRPAATLSGGTVGTARPPVHRAEAKGM